MGVSSVQSQPPPKPPPQTQKADAKPAQESKPAQDASPSKPESAKSSASASTSPAQIPDMFDAKSGGAAVSEASQTLNNAFQGASDALNQAGAKIDSSIQQAGNTLQSAFQNATSQLTQAGVGFSQQDSFNSASSAPDFSSLFGAQPVTSPSQLASLGQAAQPSPSVGSVIDANFNANPAASPSSSATGALDFLQQLGGGAPVASAPPSIGEPSSSTSAPPISFAPTAPSSSSDSGPIGHHHTHHGFGSELGGGGGAAGGVADRGGRGMF
jgi:hypothetical protein